MVSIKQLEGRSCALVLTFITNSSASIWERFNYRTQMMKGLFIYETAYREYTRACIKDFVEDNIQYAEVRPNFMSTNSLKTDCGGRTMDNSKIMDILDDGVSKTIDEIKQNGGYFGGMKVIYCTPRSFENGPVETALNECIALKKKYPHLICGRPSQKVMSVVQPTNSWIFRF